MYAMFLMTYTLFNGAVSYMAPQAVGHYDTLASCQQAAKEADYQNVKSANEIRFALLCLNSGLDGDNIKTTKQP